MISPKSVLSTDIFASKTLLSVLTLAMLVSNISRELRATSETDRSSRVWLINSLRVMTLPKSERQTTPEHEKLSTILSFVFIFMACMPDMIKLLEILPMPSSFMTHGSCLMRFKSSWLSLVVPPLPQAVSKATIATAAALTEDRTTFHWIEDHQIQLRKHWKTSNCGLSTPLPSCRTKASQRPDPALRRFSSISLNLNRQAAFVSEASWNPDNALPAELEIRLFDRLQGVLLTAMLATVKFPGY